MLAVGGRQIVIGEVFCDSAEEFYGREERSLVLCRLDVSLIEWVLVLRVNIRSWAPLIRHNEVVIEDLVRVDVNKADITIVCHTTTVVGFGNQICDGLPRDRGLAVVAWDRLAVLHSAHLISKSVSAHLPIRVVEGVQIAPTK